MIKWLHVIHVLLQIEVGLGRFTNIPREYWLCNRCNSHSRDDENQFLITCEKYDQRKEIFQ